MNILQVCPFTFAEVGGVSEHVQNISTRLARDNDVTVYVTDSRKHFPRRESINGVTVERFKRFAPSDSYFLSWDMLLALRKANFDIVQAHCYHAFPMHFARLAKCRKFIVTTHFHGVGHSTFRNSLIRLLKPFGKKTLEKADRIVAVSEYEKALIRSQFGFDSGKVVVIPNGVNSKEFLGLQKRKHDLKTILCVGNLFEYKGVHYLVEVLPKLGDDVILEIVGRGPLRRFLQKRVEQLGVYERVKFSDYLTRRELLQKFFDADVFALLSRYEAYSLVVAEALAAGTPCVVADTSALTEWIDNKSCFGVHFPISLGELARVLNHVLNSAIDRRDVGRWLGTKILDWDTVVEMLMGIYRSNYS
jgi:glycosyltransferase involved in cell wall biosynthesis